MNKKILILLLIVVAIISGCGTYRNQEHLSIDLPPSVTTSLNPYNPSLGETFELIISAEDDNGVEYIAWESSRQFSNSDQIDYFECNMQRSCSNTWELTASEDGTYEFVVLVVDSSGHEITSDALEINVQPSRAIVDGSNDTDEIEDLETEVFFTCGNNICEGGESYESCPQDCDLDNIIGTSCGDGACEPGEDADYCPGDCENINPDCGNNICDDGETRETCYADCYNSGSEGPCNSNYDCGDEQICSDGVCIDVDCRTDADCSGCRRCSYNSCVNCAQGPYGCSC